MNDTSIRSYSPKRRRLSREPRSSLNHEQERDRERVHSVIDAEFTQACPAPEQEQEQMQKREHVVEVAGETAQSRPAYLRPSAAASDAGLTFSERERDDAEPDWFAGLEALPLLALPLARVHLSLIALLFLRTSSNRELKCVLFEIYVDK